MGDLVGNPVGIGATLVVIVALARYLLSDKSVAATHTQQIASMRADIATMKKEIEVLQEEVTTQRTLKHGFKNELTRALLLLYFVRQADCTCGALVPVKTLIDRLIDEAEREGLLSQPHEIRESPE